MYQLAWCLCAGSWGSWKIPVRPPRAVFEIGGAGCRRANTQVWILTRGKAAPWVRETSPRALHPVTSAPGLGSRGCPYPLTRGVQCALYECVPLGTTRSNGGGGVSGPQEDLIKPPVMKGTFRGTLCCWSSVSASGTKFARTLMGSKQDGWVPARLTVSTARGRVRGLRSSGSMPRGDSMAPSD